jgi:hypothetical protein
LTGTQTERASLSAFLQAQRCSVLAIVEGLDERDMRRPVVVPSGWTPLGMIEHLRQAESSGSSRSSPRPRIRSATCPGPKKPLNFLVAGSLYLAYAAGLWRAPRTAAGTRLGPVLVAATAVGLLGAGTFVTDSVSGYPPGTPNTPAEYSTSGALHDLLSVPTFLGLP